MFYAHLANKDAGRFQVDSFMFYALFAQKKVQRPVMERKPVLLVATDHEDHPERRVPRDG